MSEQGSHTELPLDTGLACLVVLARLHDIAVSAEQLAHEFGPEGRSCAKQELLLAAMKSGLKAKAIRTTTGRLNQTPLPAIATDLDGTFFIIARVDQGKALIHDPRQARAEVIDYETLQLRWTGS